MRLHLLALPHTQTTVDYLTCAYTQKVRKFCRMMSDRHEVILYAGELNDAPCGEHVALVSELERAADFGQGCDTVITPFQWDPRLPYWRRFNERAIVAIRERAQRGDFLLLTTSTQKSVAEALPQLLAVEWAVGYEGVSLPYRVFESYAWLHHVYGLLGVRDGAAFDAVIPNFFDPDEFRLGPKSDYLLFVGRLIQRKGPHVAAELAKRVGLPLKVAGPGARAFGAGWVETVEGVRCTAPGLEYVGSVGLADRAELMAGAQALIVPTLYVEPFGGVAVEGMLSGTPVIASDWGAFTETVTPEVGARFRTLRDAESALAKCATLEPALVRERALQRFSLRAVGPQFDDHLERLATLWGEGWYA